MQTNRLKSIEYTYEHLNLQLDNNKALSAEKTIRISLPGLSIVVYTRAFLIQVVLSETCPIRELSNSQFYLREVNRR